MINCLHSECIARYIADQQASDLDRPTEQRSSVSRIFIFDVVNAPQEITNMEKHGLLESGGIHLLNRFEKVKINEKARGTTHP